MEEVLQKLFNAVLEGDFEGVKVNVQNALDAKFDPSVILNSGMIAAMREVVHRHYENALEQDEGSLPDLVLIDGGKGQLHVAVDCLKKLNIYGKVAIIGIAKKLEEIYFPEDSIPIYLDKQSLSLKLIQQIRDEAHRFGIKFHRDKRSKAMTSNVFEKMPGIGSKTMELLYNKYASISAIKNVPFDELVEVIGQKKAEIVRKFLES